MPNTVSPPTYPTLWQEIGRQSWFSSCAPQKVRWRQLCAVRVSMRKTLAYSLLVSKTRTKTKTNQGRPNCVASINSAGRCASLFHERESSQGQKCNKQGKSDGLPRPPLLYYEPLGPTALWFPEMAHNFDGAPERGSSAHTKTVLRERTTQLLFLLEPTWFAPGFDGKWKEEETRARWSSFAFGRRRLALQSEILFLRETSSCNNSRIDQTSLHHEAG
jgi:hypothetical protein